MLYRFREAMAVEAGLIIPKNAIRPSSTMSVDKLKECEHWRNQVLREVSKRVSKIQNPGLSQYQIRTLNDEINELIAEKGRWEYRIKHLGGRNYMKASLVLDNQGREISGTRGYKYKVDICMAYIYTIVIPQVLARIANITCTIYVSLSLDILGGRKSFLV